jgi:hypothetical protein
MAIWNITTQDYLNQERSLFEVVGVASSDGQVISEFNPFPVTGTIGIQTGTGLIINPDNNSHDAFGRQRVSEPFTLGDYKHLYAIDTNFIDSSSGAGSTITFKVNQACARLQTGIGSTASSIHQTKFYHHYQPGKSQLIFSSFNFYAPQQNATKRTGYFDDRDGIYLEQVGLSTSDGVNAGIGTYNWVIRTFTSGSATETRIPRSQWNKDKCDGTGASGFNIDFTKTQLAFIDFQWLGVGRVRCGFAHDGKLITAHEFYHSNNNPTVYIANPNLPVRCEIRNTGVGVGASFDQICSTVASEGGYVESGVDFAYTMTTTRSIPTPGGTELPLVAIRLKNTFQGYPNRISVRLNNISLYAESNSIVYKIVKLPSSAFIGLTTLGSGTIWTSASDNSGVEYCINATVYNDGEVFASGYVPSGSSQNSLSPVASGTLTTAKKNIIVQNLESTNSEIYVIVVRTISTSAGAGAQVAASLQWREIY